MRTRRATPRRATRTALCRAVQNKGEHDQAIRSYGIALQMTENQNPHAFARRASAFIEVQKFDSAIQDAGSAIAQDPDNVEVRRARVPLGDTSEGQRPAKRTGRTNPPPPTTTTSTSTTHHPSPGNPPHTLRNTHAPAPACRLPRPPIGQAFRARGRAHFCSDDLEAALADFEKVLELMPNDPEAEEDLDRCKRYMEPDSEDELSDDAAPTITSGNFYDKLFTACGKLPAQPDLEALRELLQQPDFNGDADAYLDEHESTLLMYCVGPASSDSLPMAKLLIDNGANPQWENKQGQTAMGFVNAWKGRDEDAESTALYDSLISMLVEHGCDSSEAPAF